MVAQDPKPSPPRRRIVLIAAAVALVLLALSLRWVSQPSQVAGLVLRQAGNALGLEISAGGASEYRLRGTPLLVIRDVVARQPGAATPLLTAERILVEAPWSTIRAGGSDLTVKRIELDSPQLDIAALQRWLATRPPSETRIPTLTDGVRVVRGRVLGEGWTVDALDLDLPLLHPERAARTHLRGRFVHAGTRVPFDLHLALTRPAADAGLGLAGEVGVESAPWSLPMQARLSARLHRGDDGIGLDRIRLAADARYRNGDTDEPFAFGLAGTLRLHQGELRLAPLGLAVRDAGARANAAGNGESSAATIPSLDARGEFGFDEALSMRLDGQLAAWPQAWPALPPPLGQSRAPLPFALDYRGRADLSDPLSLRLQRNDARFDGRFRLPVVLGWIDTVDRGSPLPPLAGRLSAAQLQISGAVLQGVEIEFEDDTPTP